MMASDARHGQITLGLRDRRELGFLATLDAQEA
jgi:hypothetical protein